MQVTTGGTTGVTSETQHITCLHGFVLIDERSAEVTVNGLKTIIMTYDHKVTVAARIPSYDTYLSGPSRTDRVAYLHLDIRSFMHSITTPTVRAGDITRSRQYKARHRDVYIFLKAVEHRAVGVDAFVGP